jgi:hypothetical protein
VGNHSAGKRVRAPGRHRWLNRALETLIVLSIIGIAAYAGWISYTPASAPPGSVLNAPHPAPALLPAEPTEHGVPPVPAALLSGDTTTPLPTPPKKAPMTASTRTRHSDS